MTLRSGWRVSQLLVLTLAAAATASDSAQRKLDAIEAEQLQPGSRVTFSYAELSAWAEQQVPEGVRSPNLKSAAPQVVTGTAQVDFGRLWRAEGQPAAFLSRLLDGERTVSATVRITSSRGKVQVDVQKATVAGVELDGKTLDFLIQRVVIPLYPDAAIGRPFELGHHVDRVAAGPDGVEVVIGR